MQTFASEEQPCLTEKRMRQREPNLAICSFAGEDDRNANLEETARVPKLVQRIKRAEFSTQAKMDTRKFS